ncbi:MAG: SirB2 family protein [Gammaproteobacteria bacterium]|nr:SirB2 family protein [Gammaproteobacteria bacterium]MCP5416712.1 SirB2 family protein [Chromatiaceae bacterium]
MSYYWIRQLHIATVIFSVGFFALRYIWMLIGAQREQQRWVRIVSVCNDSMLLIAGISLALLSGQYPLVAPWLTAKLAGLLAYILLGTLALKRARTRPIRIVTGLSALLSAGYIISVALTRTPAPWSILTF